MKLFIALAAALFLLALSAFGQIYRYYHPGTVWTVTTIRIKGGIGSVLDLLKPASGIPATNQSAKRRFVRRFRF